MMFGGDRYFDDYEIFEFTMAKQKVVSLIAVYIVFQFLLSSNKTSYKITHLFI
jgi:hypothetical protein